MTATLLHLAPHPDDELIGAPATLMALRDAGWRVVNLACGLGSDPAHRERRERELREACRRAGFELRLPAAPPLATPRPERAAALRSEIEAALDELAPRVVVSPDRGDPHPAHGAVAAAAEVALRARGEAAPRWWSWAVWGSLGRPTLATAFDAARLLEIVDALAAHAGELLRNDYRRLVRGRAEAAACLAPELLFGFGSEAAAELPIPEYAELLVELVPGLDGWRPGEPRRLDPEAPFGDAPVGR